VRKTIDFVCVGGQKCGTTLLHRVLSSNAHVRLPQHRKELDYYSFNYWRGPHWRDQFYAPISANANRGHLLKGDICPSYMEHPLSAYRLYQENPAAKLVVIVRNPYERLLSNYRHDRRIGAFSGSFEKYISVIPRATMASSYSRCLQPFSDLFGMKNIHVIVFEEMVADMGGTMNALCRFLDIENSYTPSKEPLRAENEGFIPRQRFLYVQARRIGQVMRVLGMDRSVEAVKRTVSIKDLFGRGEDCVEPVREALKCAGYLRSLVESERLWVGAARGGALPNWS